MAQKYTLMFNAAGCLPDSDAYPMIFDSPREAWDEVEAIIEREWFDGGDEDELISLDGIDRDQCSSLADRGSYAWHVEPYEGDESELEEG